MKKSLFYVGSALAIAFSLTGCQKEIISPDDSNVEKSTPFELVANFDETRTVNDGLNTKWKADDAINVFHAVAGSTTYVNDGEFTIPQVNLSSNKFTGDINGTLTEGTSYDWYMFYPYTAQIVTPANSSAGWVVVGSKTSSSQVQNGNNDKSHLAGTNVPLWGKITGVTSTSMPEVMVNQACSFIEFNVTNNSGSDLIVSEIQFTGTEDIVGTYYINYAGESVVFTASGGDYVSSTAKLSVQNGAVIQNEGTASFYMAIKPFSAQSGILKVSVNGYEKEINLSKTTIFSAGKIKKVNFNYNKLAAKDYVELDWESVPEGDADGLTSAELGAIEGVTVNAGSDYAESNKPYRVKLEKSTNYVIIKTDGQIDKVIINAKGFTAGSGDELSVLSVYGSADGTTWTTTKTHDVSVEVFTLTASGFDQADRYVKIGFEKKKNNVGIGRIAITKPSNDPIIDAEPITNVPVQGVEEVEWSYTVSNFEDDVKVAQVTGCVTEAIAEGGEILYSVAPNYTSNEKTGTIVLQSASDPSVEKTITVTQKASSGLSVSETTIIIPKDETSASFTVTSVDFGWNSSVAPSDNMNLSITPNSGSASESAQTITVSSSTNATDNVQELGTIVIYRNGNTSDSQKKTIYVRKAATQASGTKTYTMTLDNHASGNNNVHWLSSTTSLVWDEITWIPTITWKNSAAYGTTKDYATVGTKANPATKIDISTTGFAGKKIKSVTVECNCSSNVGPTLTIKAGSTEMLSGAALTKTTWTRMTTTVQDVILSSTDNLTLLFESSVDAGISIKEISVTYYE